MTDLCGDPCALELCRKFGIIWNKLRLNVSNQHIKVHRRQETPKISGWPLTCTELVVSNCVELDIKRGSEKCFIGGVILRINSGSRGIFVYLYMFICIFKRSFVYSLSNFWV